MKRLLFMIAVGLAVTAVSSQAQSLQATQIQLQLPNQSINGVLVPPTTGAGGYTWTLPAQSGVIALQSSGGWLVGGNDLGGTTAGSLGTINNGDVNLITGNTTRMTLLGGTAAVLLPTQTELRLGDAAGGEYSALKAPAVITGGSNDGTITYILPDALPGGEDVRLKVKTVNTTTGIVELEYTDPNTTGQIGFNGVGGQTCPDVVNTWKDVTDMLYYVNDGTIYSFEAIVEVTSDGNNSLDITWGQDGTNNEAVGVEIKYMIIDLDGTGNNQGGKTAASIESLSAGPGDNKNVYILKGYIQTGVGGTTPANSIVRLRMRAGNLNSCISAKSSTQLITE